MLNDVSLTDDTGPMDADVVVNAVDVDVDVNWSIGCITDGVAWLDKKLYDLGRAKRLWFQGIISY